MDFQVEIGIFLTHNSLTLKKVCFSLTMATLFISPWVSSNDFTVAE